MEFMPSIPEPEWLESEIPDWGLRVWHVIFICFSGVLSVGMSIFYLHLATYMTNSKFHFLSSSYCCSDNVVLLLPISYTTHQTGYRGRLSTQENSKKVQTTLGMYQKFRNGRYEFTKRQNKIARADDVCWLISQCIVVSIIAALERIRQDFLEDTQLTMNHIDKKRQTARKMKI